jgi:hypothetical protein
LVLGAENMGFNYTALYLHLLDASLLLRIGGFYTPLPFLPGKKWGFYTPLPFLPGKKWGFTTLLLDFHQLLSLFLLRIGIFYTSSGFPYNMAFYYTSLFFPVIDLSSSCSGIGFLYTSFSF